MHMLGQLNPECKIEFLEWVCREYNPIVEPGNGMTEEPESGQKDSSASYSQMHSRLLKAYCEISYKQITKPVQECALAPQHCNFITHTT